MVQEGEYYRVLRSFDGERRYLAGEVVDTADWRWTAQLFERRYIRPATQAELDTTFGLAEEAGALPARRGRPAREA